jgi:uncharacterized membrane protein
MPEPDDQSHPAAPSPEPAPSSDPSSMDLPPNVAAAIACIPLVGGIIFYILEKRNSFVRFYAMQSIIFGGAWFLFWIAAQIIRKIFDSIPVIAGILDFFWAMIAGIIHIAFVVIWIIATVKAFTGARWEIPYMGPMARKQVETGTPT